MSTEFAEELLPISGLQHLAFCPRQCALIHIERLWTENVHTAEGRVMHERAHSGDSETRGDLRITRGLPLLSRRLGLSGVADVVEFHRDDNSPLRIPKQKGTWSVYPVEYKKGKRKKDSYDEIQLCAQALCLEEMLDVSIPAGSLFYGKTRSRTEVGFSETLRKETERLAVEFHELMRTGLTPPPVLRPCCESCSLYDDCMPDIPGQKSASTYLLGMIDENLKDHIPST